MTNPHGEHYELPYAPASTPEVEALRRKAEETRAGAGALTLVTLAGLAAMIGGGIYRYGLHHVSGWWFIVGGSIVFVIAGLLGYGARTEAEKLEQQLSALTAPPVPSPTPYAPMPPAPASAPSEWAPTPDTDGHGDGYTGQPSTPPADDYAALDDLFAEPDKD